jgi:hypothetical protein
MALCYTYIRRRTMQNPGLSFREPEDGIVFLTVKVYYFLVDWRVTRFSVVGVTFSSVMPGAL